mmetsp:Transcript_4608/g.16494  ORF Transcript_4608/g.16494 Transcript_4608/m.16494 type:complete len:147 (-) Transcript_4608:1258-1698(-)
MPLGNRNILANSTLLAGHVEVGNLTHFGGHCGVHQFCQVGEHAFIAAGSIVTQDVPAFVTVQGDRARLRGLNQIGLQRFGFAEARIGTLRKAYRKIFSLSSDVELEQRLINIENDEEFQEELVSKLIETVRASKRGICGVGRDKDA